MLVEWIGSGYHNKYIKSIIINITEFETIYEIKYHLKNQ